MRTDDAPLAHDDSPRAPRGAESPQDRLALTAAQLARVREIVAAILPGADVWVFGSRATGRARPFSDLDLLFVAPDSLSWAAQAALRDRFEASDLPFRVDLVEASGVSAPVRGRIDQERISLWAARSTD